MGRGVKMKQNKWGNIALTILNILTTILSLLFLYMINWLAMPIGSEDAMSDEIIMNLILFVTVTISVDVLKWVSYYFIVIKKNKGWLLYYAFYCVMFFYFVAKGTTPFALIIPALYIPVIILLLPPSMMDIE